MREIAGNQEREDRAAKVATLWCSLLIASCLVSYQGSAFANDSTASLDAGGLTLTFNPDISMESEDLYLSPGEVRVVYRFHNRHSGRLSSPGHDHRRAGEL